MSKAQRRIWCLLYLLCMVGAIELTGTVRAQAMSEVGTGQLPGWVKKVGARREPKGKRPFSVNFYGARGDGLSNSTESIQKAIDACARAGGGVVTFLPGQYLTGALFLKSNVNLLIDSNVTLLGSQEDADYPLIWTR